MGKKKFRMIDAVLTCICVIFVAEAAAPVASIGNSQYFWWLFMLVLFLLPYGLISSELGTTYDNGGGLYDWVSAGMGSKMATRASWYYWVNFPLWMASLAVMIPDLITYMTGYELPVFVSLIVQLAFVWIIFAIASTPLADANWILNGAAVIKVFLAVFVGVLGIIGIVKNGMANPITGIKDLLPSFDMNSLSYISVIIFNLLGFEVICTMSGDMENPKKQIPKAIVVSGLVVAFIYMFGAFGIGSAIPTDELSADSGMIDAVAALTDHRELDSETYLNDLIAAVEENEDSETLAKITAIVPTTTVDDSVVVDTEATEITPEMVDEVVAVIDEETSSGVTKPFNIDNGAPIIIATAFLFMLTLFGNMASWSTGVNEVAAMAADNGDMPAIFGKRNSKERCIGAATLNSIVASVVVILGVVMQQFGFDELFWAFFALNLVTFLAAYLPIFPAFLNLRKKDGQRERPFKVPGGKFVTTILALIPMFLIAVSIFFTVYGNIPVIIGTIIAVIIGEVLVAKYGKKK